MKLYSKISLMFHFGSVLLMVSIGAIMEYLKEHYPATKQSLISYIDSIIEKYQSYNRKKQNSGLYVA